IIKSGGVGSTLSVTSATTVAGIATADLKSTTDGAAVVVTAVAGGLASDSPAVNFIDPNKPGSVTLTATSPLGGRGVTTGTSDLFPVTLTATVQPVFPTGVIANGTVVTFTNSGGTLSAITTTAAGVATATLKSAATGIIDVTASAGTGAAIATSNKVSPEFINQPTKAVVTVALVGNLPAGTVIGGATAKIFYNTSNGLGAPTSDKLGIGLSADLFAANVATDPTITGAAWQNGTQPGALQTLTFPITPGKFPTSADFNVDATSSVINLNNSSLAGIISVTMSNILIQ